MPRKFAPPPPPHTVGSPHERREPQKQTADQDNTSDPMKDWEEQLQQLLENTSGVRMAQEASSSSSPSPSPFPVYPFKTFETVSNKGKPSDWGGGGVFERPVGLTFTKAESGGTVQKSIIEDNRNQKPLTVPKDHPWSPLASQSVPFGNRGFGRAIPAQSNSEANQLSQPSSIPMADLGPASGPAPDPAPHPTALPVGSHSVPPLIGEN